MRSWRPLLLLITALLGGCDLHAALFGLPAPTYTVSASAPMELPFRESAGLMLVRGTVNGHPVDFALDTGAPVTVLINGPKLAALGLDTSQARKLGPADNPAVPVGVIQPGFSLELGPVGMSGLTAVVIDARNLPCQERFEAAGFQGVIGADLFRRFVVEVDHARQRIRLHEPAHWTPDSGAASLPLSFRSGLPFAEVQLRADEKSVPLRMLVDTGSNDALSLIAGSHPDLRLPTQGEPRESCYVAGTRRTWRGAPVDVALGASLARAVTPSYEDGDSVLRGARNGSIGIGLLKRYAFAIDYPGKRIVLQRAL